MRYVSAEVENPADVGKLGNERNTNYFVWMDDLVPGDEVVFFVKFEVIRMSRVKDLIVNQATLVESNNVNRINIFERDYTGQTTLPDPTTNYLSNKSVLTSAKSNY